MDHIYKPKKDFKGQLTVSVLNHVERMELLSRLQLKVNDQGEVDVKSVNHAEYMKTLCEVVEKHVKDIDIEHKGSGQKFESLEDLQYYEEGMGLITEVGNFLLKGLRLPKTSDKR